MICTRCCEVLLLGMIFVGMTPKLMGVVGTDGVAAIRRGALVLFGITSAVLVIFVGKRCSSYYAAMSESSEDDISTLRAFFMIYNTLYLASALAAIFLTTQILRPLSSHVSSIVSLDIVNDSYKLVFLTLT